MMNRKDLANDIWRACDIMRRDDGTTGVLEYMEQLSWLIFLKVFEDIERRLEDEAKFAGRTYQPIIERRYRWSAWARKDWGPGTPEEKHPLIKFIDDELFPYLRSLTGSAEKEKIATIFREITGNRMRSAYNLKDVITLIDKIDFNDVEDSHIVSQVYEELLLKLGKEHGIAGEFYTPRPIVRLMVKIVNPQIGETIFDPFCGSCGFLAESYKRMMESKELTVEDYETLQKRTFYAQEKKPLPYLIGVMNCILHGILTPNAVRKNTLETNIRNIPEAQRFNVILTNPPFGGKESRQIQQNFPVQSQATELLALQYVMRMLKRGGRCGIVVPEGVLFRGDAFAQVKKELLENFNLHTIISLPSGAFANVTASGQGPKTNLLFFDRTGNTKEIWYYDFAGYSEEVLDKKYTKANPIEDEDLKDCYEKWKKREISKYSWIVPVEEIIKKGYDLTAKNPNRKEEFEYKPPEELVASILEKERQILEILKEIRNIFGEEY
jgi:type I restriction enzyme M protein